MTTVEATPATAGRPAPLVGLAIVLGLAAAIAGYLGLAAVFGVKALCAGSAFAFYWLTVATVPSILGEKSFPSMAEAVCLAARYVGGLVGLGQFVQRRR